MKRAHWSSAAPIRAIFRDAFQAAGLPYFNPHSLRMTLVCLGETLCQTPEEFKAWSQNLGHEGVLTTFYSYEAVGNRCQGEIIQGLRESWPLRTMLPAPPPALLPVDSHDAASAREPGAR